MNDDILVLGATGRTGRRVVNRLRAAGVPIRSGSRQTAPPFDWADPATWEPVLTGVAGLYLMAPDGQPVDPAFLRTAVDSGVRRVVLLSSRGIEEMADERLLAAEREVRGCGAEWTIIRPDWFNQNFDEGFFQPAIVAGELVLPVGELRQPFVDADDIAAVAVAALTEPGHAEQSYEVTGPRSLSFAEAVASIGRVLGRPMRFRGSAQDYRTAQAATGAPVEQTEAEITAFAALQGSGDGQPTDVVRRVTGRPAIDFESYVEAAAAAGAWRG